MTRPKNCNERKKNHLELIYSSKRFSEVITVLNRLVLNSYIAWIKTLGITDDFEAKCFNPIVFHLRKVSMLTFCEPSFWRLLENFYLLPLKYYGRICISFYLFAWKVSFAPTELGLRGTLTLMKDPSAVQRFKQNVRTGKFSSHKTFSSMYRRKCRSSWLENSIILKQKYTMRRAW